MGDIIMTENEPDFINPINDHTRGHEYIVVHVHVLGNIVIHVKDTFSSILSEYT